MNAAPNPSSVRRFTPGVYLTLLLIAEVCVLLLAPEPETISYDNRGWPTVALLLVAAGGIVLALGWFAVALLLRGRFQFGLRTLTVLILCLAVPLAKLSGDINRVRRYQAAEKSMLDLVALVEADNLKPGSEFPWQFGFNSLHSLLGPDLYAAFVTPRANAIFANLPNTGRCGPLLGEFNGAKIFVFNRATNEDARYIAQLTSLEYLSLNGRLDDSGLKMLIDLKRLQDLMLIKTQVRGEGLRHARQLPELRRLVLIGSPITDDGLRSVATLSHLNQLNLSQTAVTDAGLAHLTSLPRLSVLNLSRTSITDAGVDQLTALAELRELDLSETAVTLEGMRRLWKSLPNCVVLPLHVEHVE